MARFRFCLLALLCLLAFSACRKGEPQSQGQDPLLPPPSRAWGLAAQREDLESLKQTLLEVHPALVKGFSPENLLAWASIEAGLSESASIEDFALSAQAAAALIKDGHTRFQRHSAGASLIGPLLPLSKGYAFASNWGAFKKGDLLLAIGGKEVAGIEESLLPLISAENEVGKRLEASSLLGSKPVLRRAGLEGEAIEIRVSREGKPFIKTLSFAETKGFSTGGGEGRKWYYELYPDSSLAVLRLNTCDPTEAYSKFLDAFFRIVREEGIRKVAVDLRQNGGGDSRVIDEFFRYLPIRSYRGFGGTVRISAASERQRGHEGKFGIHEYPAGSKVALGSRLEPNFAGKLFIIVGPATFSSANWFGVLVQDNGLGQVIGEATGNKPDSFGDVLSFTLPNSKLTYQVSYKQWLRPDRARAGDESLEPDIEIKLEPEDLRLGRDPVLDYLKALAD